VNRKKSPRDGHMGNFKAAYNAKNCTLVPDWKSPALL
jgi:hypothetical protein